MHVGRESRERKVDAIQRNHQPDRSRSLVKLRKPVSVSSHFKSKPSERRAHLSDDHVLLKRRKPNDATKEDSLPRVKVLPNNQLKRVACRKYGSLTALLVPVALAEDDRLVDPQLLIPPPRANPNVLLDGVPVPPVILRVVSDSTARAGSWVVAVLHSGVDQPIGSERVEVEERNPERVGIGRGGERIPRVAFVGGVVDFVRFANEVGAVARVEVLSHGEDRGAVDDRIPGVTFVRGLPNSILGGKDEESLLEGIARQSKSGIRN